jgi:prephenate dehydratase
VKKKKNVALIAHESTSDIYRLKVLKKGIQDSEENITRFFVISKKSLYQPDSNRTTLVFATKHRPGALFYALESFAKEHINLTRLESIPSKRKPWEYLFLVDLLGSKDEARIRKALQLLRNRTTSVKILGSYSEGKLYE